MAAPFPTPRRIQLLGAGMDLVTPGEVLARVEAAASGGPRALITNHNLHSLYLIRRQPEMAALYARADLVEIDSRPALYWARLLGLPATGAHRCTYLDWREGFWRLADAQGWRVFYLGGSPGVAEDAAARLRGRWPGARIAVHHGYFDRGPGAAENAAVIAEINAFAPQVLLVGMGMPVQEIWTQRHYDELDARAVLPVGAAFDYEAGVQRPAPRILGALGLEWLYRLAHDPRRLFFRYLVEPWSLIGPALGDIARYRLGRGHGPD
ncbi:MAG TPA: WecB/TagA/CpsF family glycosyltransferase [Caulobacteraceae bacterium]|nr:WecB/TagA/CpsF family glycosyltransferase [Caulobacteraceae bacterium]